MSASMHCQHGSQQSADDRDAIPPYTPSMTTLVDPGSKINFFDDDILDTFQVVGWLPARTLFCAKQAIDPDESRAV
ncbi:hypothetical protein VTO73DRAFT_11962 [Trametes versicolor]